MNHCYFAHTFVFLSRYVHVYVHYLIVPYAIIFIRFSNFRSFSESILGHMCRLNFAPQNKENWIFFLPQAFKIQRCMSQFKFTVLIFVWLVERLRQNSRAFETGAQKAYKKWFWKLSIISTSAILESFKVIYDFCILYFQT